MSKKYILLLVSFFIFSNSFAQEKETEIQITFEIISSSIDSLHTVGVKKLKADGYQMNKSGQWVDSHGNEVFYL
ncbi:hypothetical protein [Sphingobacterium bovistauri]|uniref:Uncharacterized protein n=1 Tax=Sphingobacterium bovistauri TaxID=2781959 RepID=A0ABS7Z2Q5_9SPHI|nr:hypothetical protein [Sphingobacterium bovistauri]MCA5004415.1 hypothetical protein [Sphingobacterium bovistauri]